MNKLDENKIYYLGDLNKEQAGELFDYIKTVGVNNGWDDRGIFISSDIHLGVLLYFNGNSWTWNYDKNAPTTNALELFYNLDNIQVDCKGLSKEQIKEMAEVIVLNGRRIYPTNDALEVDKDCEYFQSYYSAFGVFSESYNKTTITYEKFMELFDKWEQSYFGKYKVKSEGIVFHEDFDLELYKESVGIPKDTVEVLKKEPKPSQYNIGIDTFDRCEANMTKEEILACVRFNLDKYTWRKKGQDKEDFEKIISYAKWGLKQLNKEPK